VLVLLTCLLIANTRHRRALALIDLDHFKKISVRCGHAVGDHVLKEFARLSRGVLRAADTLGRWGGEEFLLVLPDTQIEKAVAIMQRLQSALADVRLPEPERDLAVSFSAGLATRTTHGQSLDEIIVCADAALYEAKSAGRNLLRLARETRRAAPPVPR
jgi:diguanylate cyclase